MKAGVPHTTVLRQVKKNELSADLVIQIAKAYEVDVIKALVDTGHITKEELMATDIASTVQEANRQAIIRSLTNAEILEEVERRMDLGVGEDFSKPMQVHPLKAKKDIPITDKRGFLTAEAAAAYAVAADSSPIEPEPGDEGYGA